MGIAKAQKLTHQNPRRCVTDAVTAGPSRPPLSLLLAFARGTETWGTGFREARVPGPVLFPSARVLLASVPPSGLIPFM